MCIALTSFSCLIALAINSSVVLKRNGKSGFPCFIPGIRGSTSDLLPLSTIVIICFTWMILIRLRKFSSSVCQVVSLSQ